MAAAISAGLKCAEVVVGFFAIGIAARDQMRGIFAARSPHQEDNASVPDAQVCHVIMHKMYMHFA